MSSFPDEAGTSSASTARNYEIRIGTQRAVSAELLARESSVNYKVFIGGRDFTAR